MTTGSVVTYELLASVMGPFHPQAPPPAYLAVFFQGLMGELLFWNRKYFRLFCVILALLAMVESAFQRVLSITIIYGNDFWTAVNSFMKKLTGSEQLTDYSYFIIFWYVLIHIIAGMLVGVWVGFLPQRIQLMGPLQKKYRVETVDTAITVPQRKRKRKLRLFLFIIWIAFMAIYIQSFFKIGPALLPSAMVLRILIRSVIIVLTWYFLIGPVLKQLLHKWLQRKKQQSGEQVQQVLNILPSTQGLMMRSWQLAADRKGWRRIVLCCKIILANTFYTSES